MIHIEKLTKKYGDFTAVDSLDLDIKEGEIFGLLGLNGAGKSTLLNMLITLVEPTSGTATINGYDIRTQKQKVRENIGFMFQQSANYFSLNAHDNLMLKAVMYGVPRTEREKRVKELLTFVGLDKRADELTVNYSGGMLRQLQLIRNLVYAPRVLFLDEPSNGIDIVAREKIWELVKSTAKEKKTTVFLTTHSMEEADFLCDRVGIIDHGKIITVGTPAELKKEIRGDVVIIQKKDFDASCVKELRFIKDIKTTDGETTLTVENARANLTKLIAAIGEVDSIQVKEASLREVFLKHTGREYIEG